MTSPKRSNLKLSLLIVYIVYNERSAFLRAVDFAMRKIAVPITLFIFCSLAASSDEPISHRTASSATPAADQSLQDTSIQEDTIKSWTTEEPPTNYDKQFMNSLKWEEHPLVNGYTMRTGIIRDRWIAAVQFVRNKQVVLTEYTPGAEYITVIDPLSGQPLHPIVAAETNHDGIPKIALLHCKLTDSNYHMYAIYALNEEKPKLLWKSGGKLGDWQLKIDSRLSH
jgi:hypothetical protein